MVAQFRTRLDECEEGAADGFGQWRPSRDDPGMFWVRAGYVAAPVLQRSVELVVRMRVARIGFRLRNRRLKVRILLGVLRRSRRRSRHHCADWSIRQHDRSAIGFKHHLLLLPQHQVHDPTAADVRPVAATVIQHHFVRAVRILERVCQDGHGEEVTRRVHLASKIDYR